MNNVLNVVMFVGLSYIREVLIKGLSMKGLILLKDHFVYNS